MLETPLRDPLDGRSFDVAVIGGGINGVAIARECARWGRSTLLLERHDFAAGTTSRSTRIIHGGLRYLEHGELGLVRESVRERQRLLVERPHLVRPLRFLLALGPGARRSALEVRAGLWIYRRLAGRRLPAARNPQAALERLLDKGGRWTVFDYEDAQCEFPERLVAEWLADAADRGAVVRNYSEVLQVEVRDGRARGVRLRDCLAGAEERVSADWIINATGPWADSVCRASGLAGQRMVGGVRGSHIVLPRLAGAPDAALFIEAVDGRPMFVIPWNEQLLVGTTEVRDDGDPAQVRPAAAEIEYLVNSLNSQLPTAAISSDQVRLAYAGVRPLPFVAGQQPAAVTRRHFLHDHQDEGAARLISIVGGKLTTAASLARECAAKIGCPAGSGSDIQVVAPEEPWTSGLDGWTRYCSEAAAIGPASARAMAEWFGPAAEPICSLAAQHPAMRQPLCPHSLHLVAEAVHAFLREQAATLADVLLRRVPVAFAPCWSSACSRAAAERIGAAMGWDGRRIGEEHDALLAEQESFLKPPALAGARR